jgi:histidinol-phosphate aminotransferase
MNRVRQPFNCNNLALAGAIAALEDSEFLAQSFELNQSGMQQINAGLDQLGLKYLPSHANFVTFNVADAAGVNQRLLKQGVIVRPLAGYAMHDWLRVTIGTQAENARFLEALAVAIK